MGTKVTIDGRGVVQESVVGGSSVIVKNLFVNGTMQVPTETNVSILEPSNDATGESDRLAIYTALTDGKTLYIRAISSKSSPVHPVSRTSTPRRQIHLLS